MADELLEEMSKDLENKVFKSNFTPVVRVKEGRTPCLEIDNKMSASNHHARGPTIGMNVFLQEVNTAARTATASAIRKVNKTRVMKVKQDRQVTTDDDGNIVFDGFVEEHDEYNMHLILQKVFYYVRPGYTLPAYPTDRVSKQKYKREYGEYKRLSSASSPSPPWISKHAIDNIAASENEDNSKYKGAHPNGMCTPSYPNKRCEKEYTYLMDLFDIVGRYTPKPPADEYKSNNEDDYGSGDEDDDDSNDEDGDETTYQDVERAPWDDEDETNDEELETVTDRLYNLRWFVRNPEEVIKIGFSINKRTTLPILNL